MLRGQSTGSKGSVAIQFVNLSVGAGWLRQRLKFALVCLGWRHRPSRPSSSLGRLHIENFWMSLVSSSAQRLKNLRNLGRRSLRSLAGTRVARHPAPLRLLPLFRPFSAATSSSSFSNQRNIIQKNMAANPTCLVAIIGVGLVGSEFISQLLGLQQSPCKIVALSSSKKALIAPDGLSVTTTSWKTDLVEKGSPTNVESFLGSLAAVARGGEKIVVVDNTSSDDVAGHYPAILKAGMHIITPNKKAFSASLPLYKDIQSACLESGVKFLNESTVGAGLPIISTLKDLVQTGDKVSLVDPFRLGGL